MSELIDTVIRKELKFFGLYSLLCQIICNLNITILQPTVLHLNVLHVHARTLNCYWSIVLIKLIMFLRMSIECVSAMWII